MVRLAGADRAKRAGGARRVRRCAALATGRRPGEYMASLNAARVESRPTGNSVVAMPPENEVEIFAGDGFLFAAWGWLPPPLMHANTAVT